MKERVLAMVRRALSALWDIICGLTVDKARFIASLCLAALIGLFVFPGCLSALDDSSGFIFVRLGVHIAGGFGWKIAVYSTFLTVLLTIVVGIFHIALYIGLLGLGLLMDLCLIAIPGLAGAATGTALGGIANILIFVLKDIFRAGISGYAPVGSFAQAGASVSFVLIHTFLLSCLLHYFVMPFLWKFVIVRIAGVFMTKRSAK